MSDYQIAFLDRRVQYLEGKMQEWEKVIDILMADPTFMHTLGVKELKKNFQLLEKVKLLIGIMKRLMI